jgi:hypothetical protein
LEKSRTLKILNVENLKLCYTESSKWACVKENATENDFCLRLRKCSRLNGAWGVKKNTILTLIPKVTLGYVKLDKKEW